MTEERLVTLVVPTRGDRPKYLAQCISSIRQQEVPHRLVLATDAEETAHRLRSAYDGVEVAVQRSPGAAAAVDEVLISATTPFCGWIGDDDMLAPGSFRRSVTVLRARPRSPGVFGHCDVIDADGRITGSIPTGRWAPFVSRFGRDFIPQPGSLFRTCSYRAAGGLDHTLNYAFDLDLFLKLARQGRLLFTPTLLARFRWHPASLTASNPAPQHEARVVKQRYLPRWLKACESLWFPLADKGSRAVYVVHTRRKLGLL